MTSTQDARERGSFAGIHALQSREAGYAVARETLARQAAAELVDPALRSESGVRLAPDAWSWYVGALGEIEVGALLSALGPHWMVRHAVPIGEGATDVDHLLVGPNGVFALNTKRHLGADVWAGDHAMKVNGTIVHHLTNAQSEARQVAKRLGSKVGFPVTVHSAIVLVGARRFVDSGNPATRSTAVVSSADVLQWIVTRPPVISPTSLQLVRLAAEEPDTWHVDPHAADTLRVMARFQRLRDEVGDTPPHPSKITAGIPMRPVRSSQARRPARRLPAPQPPRTGRGMTKPHRSRGEQLFWKIFFGVVGVPIMLFVGLVLIAELAAIPR
jgi:hypothetical protein